MNRLNSAIETIQDMLDVIDSTGSAYLYRHNGGKELLVNILEQLQELNAYKEKDKKKCPVKIVDRYNPKLGEIQVGICPTCNAAVCNCDIRCISCNQSLDWDNAQQN